MTTSILNLDDCVAVDIAAMAAPGKENFVAVPVPSQGDAREVIFQKVTGNEKYPMTVRVGFYPKPAANDGIGQTNISVKISTFVESDDDDEAWVHPGTVTIASSMPGRSGVPNEADYMALLGNALTWLVPVVNGILTSGALARLKFGVVSDLNELTDSPSA